MNYQEMVIRAKELMQEINDNGGTPYFADTFRYDRGIGWVVKADYAQEIEWQNFNYCSHETGLMEYRNLRQVVDYLRKELKSCSKNTTQDENMMWGGDEQGYIFVDDC